MSDASPLPQTVLCIPGPWQTRDALVDAVVRSDSGYLFAGQILLHMPSGQSFELEFQPPDPRMAAAFRSAGPHWSGSPEMARIGEHAGVAYLVGHGGSRANAEALMLAAEALLKAGGLGVKVESSGLAHSPEDWRKLCAQHHLFSAHRAYVLYVTGSQVYTCGMHNLGLRDAVADNFDNNTAAVVELVRTFTWYLFTEAPDLRAGQSFAVAAGAPVYRLRDKPGVVYEDGSLFANPYGFWRLERA